MSLENRIKLPARIPAHKARKVTLKSRSENYIKVLRAEYPESKKVYPWVGALDLETFYNSQEVSL